MECKGIREERSGMDRDLFERWRDCWERYLLGECFDPETAEGKQVIASLELAAGGDADGSTEDGSDVVYRPGAERLRNMALAYRTPGTKYYGDSAVRRELLDGLDRVYREEYNMDTPPDNWWGMEVGLPMRLFDLLVLLYEELPDREEQVRKLTEVFLKNQDAYMISSHGRKETGANLVWKCANLLLCGILRRDMECVRKANALLPEVLCYAEPVTVPGRGTMFDDGFYPDGSFIQHYFFAYTGGYGKHLFNVLCGLLYAFRGEECLRLGEKELAFFCRMVEQAYAPLIWQGHFMDVARGRETSRYYYQDHIAARHVTRSLCYLTEALPEELAQRMRSVLTNWLAQEGMRENLFVDESARAEYWVLPSLPEVLRKADAKEAVAAGELTGHFNFGVMAKPVHRAMDWAAAVSMYTRTTACYEYLNGESVKFWHMSDGMTYLYTADAEQYSGDYYATVDMQRLPGTTVDRSPGRAADSYYNWYMPDSKNSFSFAGGASNGEAGIVGMQYRGQGHGTDRDLEVKKSWFFLGDEIVCLGSGITSTTGDEIETVVMNHRLYPGAENEITLDSGAVGTAERGQIGRREGAADRSEHFLCREMIRERAGIVERQGLRTVHISGNHGRKSDVGYYFPSGGNQRLLCEHRAGTWNSVEINPDNCKENDFATLWLAHGTCPKDAEYAYAILPGYTAEQTAAYADAPDMEILELSASVHAVRSRRSGWLGIHFWEAAALSCEGISADVACSVMLHREGDTLEIVAADPTKEDRVIGLDFDFSVDEVLTASAGVEIFGQSPLRIRVDTKNACGESFIMKAACRL